MSLQHLWSTNVQLVVGPFGVTDRYDGGTASRLVGGCFERPIGIYRMACVATVFLVDMNLSLRRVHQHFQSLFQFGAVAFRQQV